MLFPTVVDLDFATVPQLINLSLLTLAGVQPVIMPMAELTNGELMDAPSAAEVEYFKQRGTQFQMIQVVVNTISRINTDGEIIATPYAVTLLPASKRGAVTESSIEFVAKAGVPGAAQSWVYRGFNPFSGEWSLFGRFTDLVGSGAIYFDEIGFVHDAYFLMTDYNEDELLNFGNQESPWMERFNRKRKKLLFKPFETTRPRRVWGVESPIELFLLQEMMSRGLKPEIQMTIMPDGSCYPSFYDALEAMPDGVEPSLTDADFFFSDKRIAVFCDGAHHRRRYQRERDTQIDNALVALGITPLRVTGTQIMEDLVAAGERVVRAIT